MCCAYSKYSKDFTKKKNWFGVCCHYLLCVVYGSANSFFVSKNDLKLINLDKDLFAPMSSFKITSKNFHKPSVSTFSARTMF